MITHTGDHGEPAVTSGAGIDQLAINTIRTLSIDAVQKAGSGHPGTPMGAAPTAYCLWQRILRYDPRNPHWPNRDRFVLSNGHASMLLYSLLFLAGVRGTGNAYPRGGGPAVSLRDIKTFRSGTGHCPGHPEYGHTTGVEATTGPLGQGVATSVGMALAGKWLAATYNRPEYQLFDYNVYALCGDGCLMEGISSEAASLAGHLGLDNLCWIYDCNQVTIEGATKITFSEDVESRFRASGWNVLRVGDANDLVQLEHAYEQFLGTSGQPTLIIVHSHLGYGAPHKQDTSAAHGDPLGADEVRLTKLAYGWPEEARFRVPAGVRHHFHDGLGRRGANLHDSWTRLLANYRSAYPELAAQIECMQERSLPPHWDEQLPAFPADAPAIATRAASGVVLNSLAGRVPWLVGGAADLAPSTRTRLSAAPIHDLEAPGRGGDYGGRNLHFGVREHAMCAIVNGLVLSGLRGYGATFLTFTDYARGAIRLSALMQIPSLYICTHDSISLGEDGPTHQPIEQLAAFRAMPGIAVFRPADANEVVEAYRFALSQRDRPTLLVLTRQALPTLDRTRYGAAAGAARGAYVLADPPDGGRPDVLLLATGSEVSLCITARDQLNREGIRARVVSMPCWEVFDAQEQAYRDSVLPPDITARVAVEEASTFGWEHYVGSTGTILGMHTFGLSAPGEVVERHFGFQPDHVVAAAKKQLARAQHAT